MSFTARTSLENINGIDCYKIYFSDDWQIFVDKSEYIKIKEINGFMSKELLECSFGTVKDSDVEIPSLEGYEVTNLTRNLPNQE